MITDYDDDTHFCLKCHSTILGLENYVTHRKSGCNKNIVDPDPSKSPLPSQLLPPDEIGLKADDFFSSLELRSSSKKPVQSTSGKNFSGILTRSKTTAVIQATTSHRDQPEPQQSKSGKNVWIGGNQIKDLGTGDNQSKLIKAVANLERRKEGTGAESPPRLGSVYEESDDDSEEYDYDEDETSEEDYAPPRNYTGGKWKPNSPVQWSSRGGDREWNIPPPSFTGGKWKPRRSSSPPPSYTKGKWKPAEDDGPTTGGKYPPPGHTRGKWKPSARNENEDDFPPPCHTRGKWKPKNENDDERYPPPSHTKGKWKPRTEEENVPPPSHTKGKWKPKLETEDSAPPPTYTKGKWKPKLELETMLPPALVKAKEKPRSENAEELTTLKSKTRLQIETANRDNITEKLHLKSISAQDSKNSSPKTTPDAPKMTKHTKTKLPENKTTGPDSSLSESPSEAKNHKITDDSPLRKSSGTVQYWCSACNRRLASRIAYERHLKSDLHFKRSRPEHEFDDGAMIKRGTTTVEELAQVPLLEIKKEPLQPAQSDKKRKRKKIFEVCAVCHSKVNKYIMGKHLISHYHCRKGDISTDTAKNLVLENIYSIVLESPFQCCVCRFYCNTHDEFLDHWKSNFHIDREQSHSGYFLCAFCKHRSDDTAEMLVHLSSEEHLEVVSVINRSVPIAIKKISQLSCRTCDQKFTLHIQLLNHCRRLGHDTSNVNFFEKESLECKECNRTFLNALSIQRHRRKLHKHTYFFCSFCNLKFETIEEARKHRRTSLHRYACLEKKKRKDDHSLRRKCEYCEKAFANFLLLKNHLKEEHPDHKVRCPYCGANFTVTQELSNHLKSKSCKFPENTDGSEHPYRCEKCPFSSDSTSELLYHLALHNEPLVIYPLDPDGNCSKIKPIPRYKCTICKKFFPKHSLLPHLRLHTEERPYVCKICNATFTRKNNLLYHEKNHVRRNRLPQKEPKEKKPFLCSTCGTGFGKRFTLQQHMLTHSGKVCRCPEIGCFYTARKMSELQEHFKIHSTEKNYCCNLCHYKGKTKKQLKRHITVHDATKKYHCSICTFTSRTAAHLKRHVRLHTGAKPFTCPHCDYKCNNLENLRRHILSTTKHPGKCIYECKFCTETPAHFHTNSAKEFKNHLVVKHNKMFANNNDAASFVAGIYEAQEDRTYLIDMETLEQSEPSDRIIPKTDPSESILKLKTSEDPVVAQLIQPTEGANKDKTLDQMLPMFIIPKDDAGNVEIAPESWNLIGRYDVEESGTLVPFHSGEEEELFQEHF